jgi:hypothetical protein
MKVLIIPFDATVVDFSPLTITLKTSMLKFTAKFEKILFFLNLSNDLKFPQK